MRGRAKITAVILVIAFLSGCTSLPNEPEHIAYGKVISVQHRQVVEQVPNLTGAVVGGIAGGVIGHQFGKGNGKTAMTVLGTVAGAAVGSQYNQKGEVTQVSDLVVQLVDGHTFAVTTPDAGFHPGQNVKIIQQGHKAMIEAIDN